MRSRRLHKYIGLAMLVPMFGWALTGLVFFIKPGYDGAYEQLTLKTYPLTTPFVIANNNAWQEVRVVQSVLGVHLMVKTEDNYKQLDPATLTARPVPDFAQLKMLFQDAISTNVMRYGKILNIDQLTATTSNNIEIKLDWDTLSFHQHGRDRTLIGLLYKIHYLQWTPWPAVNQVLGIIGLCLLMTLTILGIRVYLTNK